MGKRKIGILVLTDKVKDRMTILWYYHLEMQGKKGN